MSHTVLRPNLMGVLRSSAGAEGGRTNRCDVDRCPQGNCGESQIDADQDEDGNIAICHVTSAI